MMTAASRTTSFMGRAIRGAVADARSQILALAAEQLEISPDDLDLIDGEVVTRDGAQRRPVSAVMAAARTWDVYGRGRYDSPISLDLETGQGIGAPQWHPAACGCEVEVDTETGRVRLLRLHVALYVGRMINPLMCELQVEGAALFGIGQALFEEMATDEAGQLQNANLGDYLIPSFRDLPDGFGESILETPGTLVVHGIGETALPCIAPAIGNAVAQALGVRVMSLPITPEKVLRALEAAAPADAAEAPVREPRAAADMPAGVTS
jgi:CO/xanthine dehydrogenase Mo-binding subunit